MRVALAIDVEQMGRDCDIVAVHKFGGYCGVSSIYKLLATMINYPTTVIQS